MWKLSVKENICCQELDTVKNKSLEAVTVEELQAESGCMSSIQDLRQCASMHGFSRLLGSSSYEGPNHKKHRHIAYRQLVRWCWGAFGKNIRVPLLSCAENYILAHFPEPNQLEEDMIFSRFAYADE